MTGQKTIEELMRRIRMGEDSLLELKEVRFKGGRIDAPDSRQIADELSAMANSTSGTIVFGVNDKTRVMHPLSPRELDVLEAWLCAICNDSISPKLDCVIRKIPIGDDCGILAVDVPKSLFVHKGAHGYFTRIGSAKRELTPDMLARLFQQKSQTRFVCFDEQVVSQAKTDELLVPLYSRFRTQLSSADNGEFLRKLHFIAPDVDGVLRPTVAGVLFATEHPELHLPSAFIQAVCYRGMERNADYQLDARDITGPLDAQIEEACHFVERNMRVAAIKNPARIDIPQYAMNAVFEAIVNAVAHRDYSISGSKIRLHMFSDRLEIFSPGGLPNAMALDEIGERQFARNELICTCLSRCPVNKRFAEVKRERIMDKRGEGVPVILSASDRLSGRCPEYKLLFYSELHLTKNTAPIDNRKKLRETVLTQLESKSSEAGAQATNAGTFPAAHIAGEPKVEPNAPKVEPNVPKVEPNAPKVEPNVPKIEPNVLEDAEGNNVHLLRMLRGDSTLTILEMAKELKVSRETIKRIIVKLKAAGLLVREGGTRGRWRVLEM